MNTVKITDPRKTEKYAAVKAMPKRRKAELLRALRTPYDEGGYLQIKEMLYAQIERDDFGAGRYYELFEDDPDACFDGFCCLGVATDLMVRKGLLTWDSHAIPPSGDPDMGGAAYENVGMPGAEVIDYWGFNVATVSWLASLNDDDYSFVQIADAIEKFL